MPCVSEAKKLSCCSKNKDTPHLLIVEIAIFGFGFCPVSLCKVTTLAPLLFFSGETLGVLLEMTTVEQAQHLEDVWSIPGMFGAVLHPLTTSIEYTVFFFSLLIRCN